MGNKKEKKVIESCRIDFDPAFIIVNKSFIELPGNMAFRDVTPKREQIFEVSNKTYEGNNEAWGTFTRFYNVPLILKTLNEGMDDFLEFSRKSLLKEIEDAIMAYNNKIANAASFLKTELSSLKNENIKGIGKRKTKKELNEIKKKIAVFLENNNKNNANNFLEEIKKITNIITNQKLISKTKFHKAYDNLIDFLEKGVNHTFIEKISPLQKSIGELEAKIIKINTIWTEATSLTDALKFISDGSNTSLKTKLAGAFLSIIESIKTIAVDFSAKLDNFLIDTAVIAQRLPKLAKWLDDFAIGAKRIGAFLGKIGGTLLDFFDVIFDGINLVFAWQDYNEKNIYNAGQHEEINKNFFNSIAAFVGTLLLFIIGIVAAVVTLPTIGTIVSITCLALGILLGGYELITGNDAIGENGYWWYKFFTE